MSVDSRLVRDVLVQELLERAEAHAKRGAGDLLGDEASDLAALGYCARLAETDLFEPARTVTPGLAEELERLGPTQKAQEALFELGRRLAEAEPSDRPDPGDGVTSWRVPGPGGHVRHYLAMLAVERRAPDTDYAASKRAFLYGFFVRCCEEAAEAERRS
jgi:hypothetical protein